MEPINDNEIDVTPVEVEGDDSLSTLPQTENESTEVRSSKLLIAQEGSSFDIDRHVKTVSLGQTFSELIGEVVIMVKDNEIKPFLDLVDALGIEASIAQTIESPTGMFAFNTRELRVTSLDHLPITNVLSDKPDVSGMHNKKDNAFSGIEDVTERDVEEAIEKFSSLKKTSSHLFDVDAGESHE